MLVRLRENGDPVVVRLDREVGVALNESRFVDARPVAGHHDWEIRPLSMVGAIRVGAVEVHVEPKVEVSRVVFMIGYSAVGTKWRSDRVGVEHASDLLLAMAEVFTRATERAFGGGLLQGYRTVEESLTVVRGRIREMDQLRRRFGVPLPIEVRFDDYTVDIAENRLIKAALGKLIRIPGLDGQLRQRIRRLEVLLADVTPSVRGGAVEKWHPTRLNARYLDALYLAEAILAGSSFEVGRQELNVSGFVIDMARVFEDFVCRVMKDELESIGGRVECQDAWTLDLDDVIKLKPDLVWYPETVPSSSLARKGAGLVVDAKYKAEKNEAFPNADVYQMLAYCSSLELPEGHLIYAKGNEVAKQHHLRGSSIKVYAHAVDLSLEPAEIVQLLQALSVSLSDGLQAMLAAGASR